MATVNIELYVAETFSDLVSRIESRIESPSVGLILSIYIVVTKFWMRWDEVKFLSMNTPNLLKINSTISNFKRLLQKI